MNQKGLKKISLLKSKNLTYLFISIFVLILVVVLILLPDGIRLTGKAVLNTDITKSSQKISNTTGNLYGEFFNSSAFGAGVASLGDFDGDAITDIVVGAWGDLSSKGAIYVLFMYANGTVNTSQKISSTKGNFQETLGNYDLFGSSVASIGDLDSDGITDIVVGAYGDDDGGASDRGAVYVLFMYANGTVNTTQKISDTEGNFQETLDGEDHFGESVTSADINNDSITDLVVGAGYDDDGETNSGAVYVLFMYQNGSVNTSQKISNATGNLNASQSLNAADSFGRSVASIGDLDGDGVTDLVVGAYGDDDGASGSGAVYVLFMNANGTVKTSQKISNTQGNFQETLDGDDYFGNSVASIGDLDGDGITDIAVGAHGDDDGGSGRGAVYLLLMNINGSVKSSQKISDTEGNFNEVLVDLDTFGASVASIDDLDGDGITDIVVGASGDDDGGLGRGAAYVLFLYDDFVPPSVTFSCTPSSVVIGETITCSCTGTDGGSGVASTTYTVNPSTAVAGTFSTICTVTDVTGNSATSTVSYTVSVSGGGVTKDQPTETHSWDTITENEPTTMTITESGIDLTEITVITSETVTGASVTVTEIDVTPQSDIKISAGGVNYQGFKIDTIGINDTNIASVIIDFKVNKTWLEEENFTSDDVSLYRKPEQANIWDELNTTFLDEDEDYYYFSAISPGFSLFVVLMDLSICNNNNVCESELGEDEVNCSNDCTEKKGFFETVKTYLWNGVIIILAISIVVVILIIRFKIKKRKESGKI